MENLNTPDHYNPTQNNFKNNWATPIAIVVAGALVAAGLYFSRTDAPIFNKEQEVTNNAVENAIKILETDHVRGNQNAPVKIIVYSDFECPYCKLFHQTMKQVMADYPNDVAWIYRNLPIQASHPKAVTEAIAAECVNELGGNDKYWQFVDRFFEITPSNNQTDLSVLPEIAGALGINGTELKTCMESGKYTELINKQFNEAVAIGGSDPRFGTPWSLVASSDGRFLSIYGAENYTVVKQILQTALAD